MDYYISKQIAVEKIIALDYYLDAFDYLTRQEYIDNRAYRVSLVNEVAQSIQNKQEADPVVWSAWDAVRTDEEKVSMIAELLSRPGADVNIQNRYGITPLHYLAASGSSCASVSLFQKLLRHPEIYVNIQTTNGETPLHVAIAEKHENLARELLAHPDVDINARNIEGKTLLHYAMFSGNTTLVQELLARPNINVNIRDHCGTALLHLCMLIDRVSRMTPLLIQHPNIDVNLQNTFGITSLHIAVSRGQIDKVVALLAHPDIDVNVQAYNGERPLHFNSIYKTSDQIVYLLLQDPKIDVNVQNTCGNTPLHHAVNFNQIFNAGLLLAYPKTNPSIKNNDGKTALTRILNEESAEQSRPMAKLFLEAGAYTPDELDLIKEKHPEVWKEYERKFYQTQKALDEGPLAGLPSVISSLIAEALHPGVLFWNASSTD